MFRKIKLTGERRRIAFYASLCENRHIGYQHSTARVRQQQSYA